MTNKDLDLAREWANKIYAQSPECQATVKIIQSLPDEWFDAGKLRKIYDLYRDSEITLHEAFHDTVALLPTPPLPTLADMSFDELKNYIEKKVTVDGWANPALLVAVIGDEGAVLAHRWNKPWPFVEVHPLTNLTPVAAPEQETENTQDPAQPRPEDVPPGEPWSVRYWGKEWVGVRSDHHMEPWSIISMDGLDYRDAEDSEITLMFRLVPETL